jgi:hypothetical protein
MLHTKIDIAAKNEFYETRYFKFIESRSVRSGPEKYERGYERHHIIPRCFGGHNSLENFIKLTPREHYIAHMLLWKAYGSRELAYAFRMMANRNGVSIGGKQYETLRLSLSHSEETKEKIRQAHLGVKQSEEHIQHVLDSRAGYKHSEKTKQKISLASAGKSKSEETKKRMSISKIGTHQSKETIEKRFQSRQGYQHSEETKQRMSEKAKGRQPSEAAKIASSLHHKGKPLSGETKIKMRESQRKRRELEKEGV